MNKKLRKPAQAEYTTKRAWLNAMEHCLVELDRKDSIAAENLELGRKLLQSGRLCDDRDIRSGQLFQLLGELTVTVGDKSTALPYFLKCVACYEVSHPESIAMARAHAWISSCLLDSNAYGDAISSLKRTINILEPHQLNDANLWWWVIHSCVFYQSKRGKTREIVSAMRRCLPVAHHSCKDLKPALEICAQISMRRASVGAEAANLLKELLESRYSHYKSHNQAQKPTLKEATDIDLLLNALEDVLVRASKPDTWASIWCPEGWLIFTETGGHDDSVRFYLREDDEQIPDRPFCILPDCFGSGAKSP